MKSREALINHEVLKWARERMELSIAQVSKKAKFHEHKILEWEKGVSKPSLTQLRKIGTLYKRPIAIFFLPKPPKDFDALHDFRIPFGSNNVEKSPNLIYAIRTAYTKREIALDVAKSLNENILSFDFTASLATGPEAVSKYMRSIFSDQLAQPLRFNRSREAFNFWKKAIENLGVLVFQSNSHYPIASTEMSGFSISQKEFPVIVLNSKDYPKRKIFTLFHEFTHLLLKVSGICNNLDETDGIPTRDRETEFFCNKAAAYFLIPSEDLLKHELVIRKNATSTWSDEEIVSLADLFYVSREVMLRRLLSINKISKPFYAEKLAEYQAFYKALKRKEQKGFTPPYRLLLSSNGELYSRLIINAFHNDIINLSEASEYIGGKVKHLFRIEHILTHA